ncbi:MAG: nuclear transport factor 2 family protein [Pseudomonadota bacterium]
MLKPILTVAAAAAVITSCTSAEKSETTMSSKEIVGTFLGAVSQGDADTMRELANPGYIQHNPFIPTGLEPFIELLPVLEAAGTTAENVRMFQDDDYVFMHNVWRNAEPFGAPEMVAYDIIRVDESGKVAEHWDALQPLVAETVSGRTQTDGPTEATDLDQTEANKALAVALIEDVLMGKDPAKITEYISAESYAQHNPTIADGLDGIIAAVETLTAQGNTFVYTEIHAVLGEGNFVLTVSEGEWSGGTHAFYDLFRMEDGMIVEHWDVIQPVPTEGLANTNGMFTGFVGVGPDSIGE